MPVAVSFNKEITVEIGFRFGVEDKADILLGPSYSIIASGGEELFIEGGRTNTRIFLLAEKESEKGEMMCVSHFPRDPLSLGKATLRLGSKLVEPRYIGRSSGEPGERVIRGWIPTASVGKDTGGTLSDGTVFRIRHVETI